MKRPLLALCILSFLGVPSSASAQAVCKTKQGKELWIDGAKAYNVQKYEDAIAKWEAAYLECDDPELLFNLAQANRKAEHYERARDLYKAWLRDPMTKDDSDRALVKKKVAELDELIAKQKQNVDSPPDGVRPKEGANAITTTETQPSNTTPPVAESELPRPTSAPVAPPAVAPADEAPPRWYANKWGWILAGSGTTALLVGAGFLIWSNGIEDDARSTVEEDEANRLFDDAETKRTIGAVTMIAGGALLATAVVHFVVSSGSTRSRSHASSVAVGPSWVAFSWSF